MTARLQPLTPPFDDELQAWFDAVMHGKPPLLLFTTLARDRRLFANFLRRVTPGPGPPHTQTARDRDRSDSGAMWI